MQECEADNAYALGQSAAAAPAIPAGAWTPRLSGWSDEETGTQQDCYDWAFHACWCSAMRDETAVI